MSTVLPYDLAAFAGAQRVDCVDSKGNSLTDYTANPRHICTFNAADRLTVSKLPRDNARGLKGWLVMRKHGTCGVHCGQCYIVPTYKRAVALYNWLSR